MIDSKLLRDDFQGVVSRLETRGVPENLSQWQDLDSQRRSLLSEAENIRAEKNKLNPEIAKAKKSGEDTSELLADLKKKGEREKQINQQVSEAELKLKEIELIVPNLPDGSVPIGKTEADNRVEKTWGEKPEFDFQAKPHWEVGENLGILDFERAAKISGARFCLYRGDGARLERALINFMLEEHRKNGYQEIIPPLLVKEESMTASGQLPKFEEDLFKTEGEEDKRYLIPTSEVALVNIYRDEILEEADLPVYLTAFTPCFRAEAGSHGRDVRGLIRLHQFNKVELVKLVEPEQSFNELEKLTENAEGILEALGLPYQRVTLSRGDMGLAAAKTYDLEVWLPGMEAYREISSCSNTTDYQSRRSKIRYRPAGEKKPKLVHMLNGSGLAVGRTVVAILENYQQKDGSVFIPEVLQPFMGGQEKIVKA